MSKCKLEKISTSSQNLVIETHETTAVSAEKVSDALKSPQKTTSTSSLKASATQFQVLKNHLAIPKPKVLNVCSLCGELDAERLLENQFASSSSTVSKTQNIKKPNDSTTNSSQRSHRLGNHRPTHTRPPFLYEQYPLKPALLYDSPLSYLRDPLNRLDQIDYLPRTSLHSFSSLLPICQCALVNLQSSNSSHNFRNIKYTRLHSGEEEDRRREDVLIAEVAWETREVHSSAGKSVDSVCSVCRRPAFIVPRDPQYASNLETSSTKADTITTYETDNPTKLSVNYFKPQERDKLDFIKQENVESLLFYNKSYHYKQPIVDEIPLIQVRSADNNASINSHDPDFHNSVPVFEVLSINEIENYSNRPVLKHKDSLLLYEKLRQRRKHSKLIIGEGQPLNKSSDEDIIFGSAKGLNYKLQSWEGSRIDWLSELERRHEVRRRRQKRMEYRKQKQHASEGCTRQYSFLCQRIRSWLAKWVSFDLLREIISFAMSKQSLMNQSENGKNQKSIKITAAQPLYTFYQPHLFPPPTDYMFLDDNPTKSKSPNNNSLKTIHQLHISSGMEQNRNAKASLQPIMKEQISNKEQRQQSGASCIESRKLSEETHRFSLKSNALEDIGKCETSERDSNESVKSAEAAINSTALSSKK